MEGVVVGSSFWVDDSDELSDDGSVHSFGRVVVASSFWVDDSVHSFGGVVGGSSFRVDESVVLSVDEEVHGGMVVVSAAHDVGLVLVKQMHSFPANKIRNV